MVHRATSANRLHAASGRRTGDVGRAARFGRSGRAVGIGASSAGYTTRSTRCRYHNHDLGHRCEWRRPSEPGPAGGSRAAASSCCFDRPASHGVEPGAVATHGDCREPRRCTRARCPGAEGTHDARQSGQAEAGTRSGRRDNRPGVAGMVRTRNRESRRRARHDGSGVGPIMSMRRRGPGVTARF